MYKSTTLRTEKRGKKINRICQFFRKINKIDELLIRLTTGKKREKLAISGMKRGLSLQTP